MPLAHSEMQALKLEGYPLRILLPERQIRRRGVRSVGAKRGWGWGQLGWGPPRTFRSLKLMIWSEAGDSRSLLLDKTLTVVEGRGLPFCAKVGTG